MNARPTHPRMLMVTCALAALSVTPPSLAIRARDATRPVPPRETGGGRVCVAQLVVRQTHGAQGCFIDERVTAAPGVLRYPCGGGPATATFRNGRFAGTVSADGAVRLSLTTRFHFTDGCDWRSAQGISGSLPGPLRFEYAEAPQPGRRGCAPPCAATGEVEVHAAPSNG